MTVIGDLTTLTLKSVLFVNISTKTKYPFLENILVGYSRAYVLLIHEKKPELKNFMLLSLSWVIKSTINVMKCQTHSLHPERTGSWVIKSIVNVNNK